MQKSIGLVLIYLLVQSAAATLPFVNLSAVVGKHESLFQKVQLKAQNVFHQKLCYYSYPDNPDRLYPHTFEISSSALAGNRGDLFLDVDLKNRFYQKVSQYFSTRNEDLDIPEITASRYIELCDFKITQISLFTIDSALILKDDKNSTLLPSFVIKHGKTKSYMVDLNPGNGDHLELYMVVK